MKTVSRESIETVKATIPFLVENGTALTQHFYAKMFKQNPEVKKLFNGANQSSGSQHGALAGAICAFAQNIETPEKLADAVSRISHKHASLGIQPEHYPIVGKNLLESIDDLLNPAPPEVLEAWGEAYGFLVDVLVNAEKDLYKEQASTEGGWNGFRKFEVVKREKEAQWITSFYLKPVDGGAVKSFTSGQYLTVRIPSPEGETTMRNYSLSGSPEWDHYRISVKREIPRHADTPEGYASSYLHTKISVGDQLEIGPPAGDFFLQKHAVETPIVLLSGGVGITPLISMLHSVGENPVNFIHCAVNGEMHALRDEVNALAAERPHVNVHFRYSAPSREDEREKNYHSSGILDVEFLQQYITPETEVYFCGPKPMMLHIYKALKEMGHPAEKVHFEFFGPRQELEE